jgi:heme O synthase-like polyprenyltransferase
LGKRVQREVEAGQLVIYPWWTWLFLGPFFIGDPRAKAPGILSGLLIWIACVLCAWMLLVLSAITVNNIHDSLHQKSDQAIQRTANRPHA